MKPTSRRLPESFFGLALKKSVDAILMNEWHSGFSGGKSRRWFRFPLYLFVALSILSPLVLSAQGPGPAAFTLDNVQGEVLHVADGQGPVQVKSGEKITGGRLVTLEEGTVKITFPDGKDYPVPPNTLLFLDPKYNTLEGAVAAAAAIRDPSVQFVMPAENAALPLNQAFTLLVGVDLSGANFKGIEGLTLQAVSVDDPARSIELGTIETTPPKPAAGGKYRYYKTVIGKTPAKAGEYELIVKTVEKPLGKKVGKARSVTFGQ